MTRPDPTAPPPTGQRLTLFDLPLDVVTLEQTLDRLGAWMFASPRTPHTVVTLNPELIVQSRTQPEFLRAVREADLVTADGVGIVWAVRQLDGREVPRAPGYDIVKGLMERHGADLRVFFLGAKPGVAEQAAQNAVRDYGIQVAGVHHGYFDQAEDQRVAELIGASGAHLVLTGMGAGRQEIFNQYWRQVLNAPVLIGCGGVIDVFAGTADLAPAWTRKLGVEFIWRVGLDRKRWNRAPRLAQFVRLVQAEKRRMR
ncbi:glycosyltransferase [Deinococcus metallilatus]|uniref:N-acetylglucosaminyldiphosphoundecaprenol N-acetyl-beta-D-mannosaminyltransferase n=1 Tax=Deinococcus metallilatus TaxID=1211322 RepID=A0AAJ5F5L2_9DEIO|nr:WecB/TagA/CpsF family glycosyltransferase [Deinococcus metallilatus]MBB5294056.1 N-acetylglucosaminyldiphosphoundecaprenol N-acetyl-beta-D-mannosaminyltransferase [Deinococcus metallilatus]QBY08844.1 glycosyltransferase [Deinococcus metallilatus]RXJ09988.1 glycosyltransferase [Deinococcus metallilatus]TLK28075.1 WecB/TagA/CpsF family glycosyltransferase [Deinococcus metallilatus]GMA16609.1 UDP-N-acetyl-D-mannosaminuronic acid transferase [Deinococcus metallilatus]